MRFSKYLLGAMLLTLASHPALAADQVLVQTSLGNITLQLDRAHAPVSVENFLRYVKEGHYDGTVFYRVVPGFVIQAGSYEADGTFRHAHAPIMLESNNGLRNVAGALAMARETAPNSATSEFFIDLFDNADLDPAAGDAANTTGYAVFGHVVSGMDVVNKIASVPLGDDGPVKGAAPVTPVTITKVSLLP